MDFDPGKVSIFQALALMNDENELSTKIAKLMNSVHEDKSRTVTLLCEALALQKQEVEKKKKVVDLLDEISKWWRLLVDDREKLLLTISNLELEKEEILKKLTDPKDIYGPLRQTTSKKRSRLATADDENDDDFQESSKTPAVSTITLDE